MKQWKDSAAGVDERDLTGIHDDRINPMMTAATAALTVDMPLIGSDYRATVDTTGISAPAGQAAETKFASGKMDSFARNTANAPILSVAANGWTEPEITASTTELTNRNVILTATFPDWAAVREYSFDGLSWYTYYQQVVMSENGPVHFRYGDGDGNYSNIGTYQVTNIDKVAPEVPSVTPSTREKTYDPVTLTVKFSEDSVKKEYSLDGETWHDYTRAVVVEKNGSVFFRSTDAAGNTSVSMYDVTNILTSDPKAPSTLRVAGSVKNYNITLSWAKAVTSDKKVKVAQYQVSVNGNVYTTKSTKYTLKNVELGDFEVMVRAIDSEGRVGQWSDEKSFVIKDVTAPVVKSVKAKLNGYNLNLSWTGTDKKGKIESYSIKFNGVEKQVLAANVSSYVLQLTEADVGKNKISITAFDGYNYSKTVTKNVTVKDATPPSQVINLSSPDVNSATYRAVLTWDQATDNSGKIAKYEIRIDGKVYTSKTNSFTSKKLLVGEHTYSVRAIDGSKNAGAWSEAQTFTVHDVTPPAKVSVKVSVVDNRVTATWNAPKDNVGVTGYQVWYGATPSDMSLETVLNANQRSFSLDNVPKGTYYYAIVAVDAAGNSLTPQAKAVTVKTDLPQSAAASNDLWDEACRNSGNGMTIA